MTGQEVLALVKKHGNQLEAAKAAGVAKSTFNEWVKKARNGRDVPSTSSSEQSTKKVGRSLSDFRSAYDKDFIIPTKIKDALKTLAGGWEYEVSFAKIAGVSLSDLAAYRDQFAAYVVVVKRDGKRAWAGSASMAKAMREMVS
jgi:hypothetical protein